MDAILIKVFATALALSLVTTRPDDVKTQFDPVQDRAEVTKILSDGCAHMRKAFDIENIDLDDLIATAMTDKQAMAGEVAGFHGLKFDDLYRAYRQFCKNDTSEPPVVDLGQVIEYYNQAAASLPDHNRLKGLRLPGRSVVLDGKGRPFAEVFEPEHRRQWIPLNEIPQHVQQAFIAAEDKRFYSHHGVDERSVIRAFMNTLGSSGKRQGGSTITQQVAKNLLVGDALTYERKIREIIEATRVEKALSKQEILEIYLNAIYLGRSSWGIEMAARSYFGKSAKDLTVAEGAFLAGLVKGPNYYNPDRHRERARERFAYVLDRMHEDGVIGDAQLKAALAEKLPVVAYTRLRRDTGFYAVDQIGREARAVAGINSLTLSSYSIHSTIDSELQRAAETGLQEGLARYERRTGRARFEGAEMNLGDAIQKLESDPSADHSKPSWQLALQAARPPLYDVHWPIAVVLSVGPTRGGAQAVQVGLRDGRVLPLSVPPSVRRQLAINDVIFVHVTEGRGKQPARAELRIRPKVQGAAVVLDNATGRILAMAGGFSYPLSQLNRATQSRRQPGSALKPLTYLAALNAGLQPNTLVLDAPITLAPIGDSRYSSPDDWWTPKNYSGGGSGVITLRQGLEYSKNLVTARLLDGGIMDRPEDSLDEVCRIAKAAQLYSHCERYYPFVLGAQPVRPVDLAGFYAAVVNEGARPTPHLIESIEQDGKLVYRADESTKPLDGVDRPAIFQLRTFLQGVVARGTARSIAQYAAYVGGKTGTSDQENDAWFVGFDNNVTIAVWVGYDNGKGRRTLGGGQTGASVALPIFTEIMQSAWATYAPKTVLRGPSPQTARQLVAVSLEGARTAGGNGAYTNYFRVDRTGRIVETENKLVSRGYDGYEPWGDRTLYDGAGGWRVDFDRFPPFFRLPRPDDSRAVLSPFGSYPYQQRPPAAIPAPPPQRYDWSRRFNNY